MDNPIEQPEPNPYEAPQSAPKRRSKIDARPWPWALGIVLVPVAVAIGGYTACNGAMNAGDADVIGSTIGGGVVAGDRHVPAIHDRQFSAALGEYVSTRRLTSPMMRHLKERLS